MVTGHDFEAELSKYKDAVGISITSMLKHLSFVPSRRAFLLVGMDFAIHLPSPLPE